MQQRPDAMFCVKQPGVGGPRQATQAFRGFAIMSQ